LDSSRFRRIWPSVRDFLNAQGRYKNYQTRQGELREREAETRDAAEAATQARIAGLEQELTRYRDAFRCLFNIF
jgi:hypothetical protein